MADKYIYLNSGIPTEREATTSSAGAGDSGKVVALNAQGDIDVSMMPPGVAAEVYSIECTEDLSAGDFVNIYDSSGAKCRKADATTAGKHAHGYVLSGYTSGQNASVYFEGSNNQVAGATPGDVYLNTSAGGFTSTPPSGSGNVVQRLGVAVAATEINVELGQRYVLA